MRNREANIVARWQSPEAMPSNVDGGWSLWEGRRRIASEFEACRRAALHWDPIFGWLIGQPGSSRLAPLNCVPELADEALSSYSSRLRRALLAYLAVSALLFAGALHWASNDAACIAAMPLILAAVVAADAAIVQFDRAALEAKARFVAWVRLDRRSRVAAMTFAGALGVGEIIQIAVEWPDRDVDAAFRSYGVMYERLSDGQWWRILTGPFVHSGVTHLAANAVLGCIGFGVLAALGRQRLAWAVFLLGNTMGAAAEFLMTSGHTAGMTGVSGGVYALFGTLVAMGCRREPAVPRGAIAPLIGVAAMSIPLSLLSGSHVAVFAHAGGLLAGVMAGALLRIDQPSPSPA